MQRVLVVGASLAGLSAVEALREYGFEGELTVVGEEPHAPYDRPPLSKQVALGISRAEESGLPNERPLQATWKLGAKATKLDVEAKRVFLSSGEHGAM